MAFENNSVARRVSKTKLLQERQRAREKFNEWANKIKSALESKNDRIGIGSQCKMLISWGKKLNARDPNYYSQRAAKIEISLKKRCIERLDLNCLHDLKMASKHGLETAIRRNKVISVIFSMIHYIFPMSESLNLKAPELKSFSLIEKYLNEMVDQVDELDEEQLISIIRYIQESMKLGAEFNKNLVIKLQRERIGRMTSKSIQEDLENGESDIVEFKSQFPQNATELAEVIASFATSNGGRIFLGVEDNGTISGLDMQNFSTDDIKNRISNLAQKSIDPPVKVIVDFFKVESKISAVVKVPKGSEPVYFVNGYPYIRILTSSCKANASHVKELHRQYFEHLK